MYTNLPSGLFQNFKRAQLLVTRRGEERERGGGRKEDDVSDNHSQVRDCDVRTENSRFLSSKKCQLVRNAEDDSSPSPKCPWLISPPLTPTCVSLHHCSLIAQGLLQYPQ